ncbi:MAG: hypothetical protein HXS54_01405 [Theionarchaea archaeon]|nr:hypothetical protein [Theionarchaea archaeon]
MSLVAGAAKKIGITGSFIIIVAVISDLLGFTGDRDIYDIVKTFIIAYKEFFLGVFAGLIVAGFTGNWYLGLIAALIVIFLLYTVVSI